MINAFPGGDHGVLLSISQLGVSNVAAPSAPNKWRATPVAKRFIVRPPPPARLTHPPLVPTNSTSNSLATLYITHHRDYTMLTGSVINSSELCASDIEVHFGTFTMQRTALPAS